MRWLLLVVTILCLISCSNRYKIFTKDYQFKSADAAPHYEELDYWAAHPWKKDPSDSFPSALSPLGTDSTVDIFFIHPTTYTRRTKKEGPNAAIDNALINARTDYSTILYQASVFNNAGRVFAPRYRQAHITNFFSKNEQKVAAAFEVAYSDLKASFLYYINHLNKNRPYIIAAHSQGSLLAKRLMRELIDANTTDAASLRNRLVVAYIVGWPVEKNFFSKLPPCEVATQTGCICSWRTLRKGFVPYYMRKERENVFVTNPLNWTTTSTYASRRENKGSVLTNFNTILPATTDAQVNNGVLFVQRPKFPGSFFYITRNYHIGDINLFYINLRENVSTRIAAFWKK